MARLRRQARPAESPSAPGQHPRQGIHPRPRARHHRPAVRRSPRLSRQRQPSLGSAAHWQWQRGGWLLVNRLTAHISPINLPEFDAFYSAATWYRDYAAYCGVSEDGKKILRHRRANLPPQAGSKKAARRSLTARKMLPGFRLPRPHLAALPARVTFEPTAAETNLRHSRPHRRSDHRRRRGRRSRKIEWQIRSAVRNFCHPERAGRPKGVPAQSKDP